MVNILSLLIHLILICILYHVKAHILFLAQNRVPYVYLTDLIVVLTAFFDPYRLSFIPSYFNPAIALPTNGNSVSFPDNVH